MVPKPSRLPRSGFRERGYRTIRTRFFSLKYRDNGSAGNRIGVVVGVAVDKRAVRRNFWERQAKAFLLRVPPAGKDLLLIVSPGVKTLTKKEFNQELSAALPL